MNIQLTTCPEPSCRVPAEITDRFVLHSTAGAVEHVRVYCVARHIFTLPTARLGASDGVRS
jgi:hypothetical protein